MSGTSAPSPASYAPAPLQLERVTAVAARSLPVGQEVHRKREVESVQMAVLHAGLGPRSDETTSQWC